MARVRPAVYAALLLVLLVAASAAASIPRRPAPAPLAAVGWPPSTGLVVAEVVTGGASASDEYVEIANAGAAPADLAGLEVAYATSSGTTVTKKASWTTPAVLVPGQHLLIANSAGAYASIADAVYSTGLAATGGAIVLRATGGSVLDAVGWGDAANSFVEGTAAPAPASGQSIERRPGGSGGNTLDTNSNSTDFAANAAPVAQNLAAEPVPSPSASPTPSATPTPAPTPTSTLAPTPNPTPTPTPVPTPTGAPTDTPTPMPTPTLEPTPTPSPRPVPTASPTLEPTATPSPTPSPTLEPTPTLAPTPSPTLEPTPVPTASPTTEPTPGPTETPTSTPPPTSSPTPTPDPVSDIATVRSMADGATAQIEGVLTTGLGSLETGRAGFVQDATGGIALYLDAAYPVPLPAGTWVHAMGTVGSRYGERTLRATGSDVIPLALAGLPSPLDVTTGAADETVEGLRVRVTGLVTETPSALADGLGITVDDGSGPVRVIAAPDALAAISVAKGDTVTAIGPLGQRDSSGTGIGGYRVFATLPGELSVAPPQPTPTPTPTATPSESASPSPSPSASTSASPSASPAPSPSPSQSPSQSPNPSPVPTSTTSPVPSVTASPSPAPSASPVSVAAARALEVGTVTTVRGVVIAEAGRLGTPALFAIGDDTGGLPIRLADGMSAPARGTVVIVRGAIAAPYGQTELRLQSGGLEVAGQGTVPSAQTVAVGSVGEGVEGRLVIVAGTVSVGAAKATSGDIVLVISGSGGATLKVYADGSAGVDAATLKKGVTGTFTGIVGQHASRKGALDGYRVWLRGPGDVHATTTPTPSPSSPPSPTGSATPATEPIATARVKDGTRVTVIGIVTAPTTLLDASGRRAVIQDATAAIELYLTGPNASVRLGARVRVTGEVGRAWGAPRLHAETVTLLGTASPTVLSLRVAPGAATEWRLVKVEGVVKSVHKAGDRWVAEVDAGGFTVPITSLAGAGIPVTAIAEGRRATVTGIVKRPYPTASDRRYAILPRFAGDIVLGVIVASASPSADGSPAAANTGPGASPATPSGTPDAPTADLRDLADKVGQRVRVGGLVTELRADGLRLDDGTATATVVLGGGAADLVSLVAPGDALDATGTVELRDGPVLVVVDPADVALLGDLGGTEPTASPAAQIALAMTSGTPDIGAISSSSGTGGSSAAPAMGMLAAVLVTLAAVVAVAARRLRARQAVRARVSRRLAAWAATGQTQGQTDA